MSGITVPVLTSADLGDEEAFNSRFGVIVSKLNTGLDTDNLVAGAVTRAKIGQEAITQAKMNNTFTWTNITFSGAWVDWGDAAFGTPGYFKDARDNVHMRGLVRNPSNATGVIFVLPVGYRPPVREIFTSMNNGTFARIDVLPNGEVTHAAGPATNSWHSLANITFRAVQ